MNLNKRIYEHVLEYGIASITDMFDFLLKEILLIRLKIFLFFIINIVILISGLIYISMESLLGNTELYLIAILVYSLFILYRLSTILYINNTLYIIRKYEFDVIITIKSKMSKEDKEIKIAYISSVMIKNIANRSKISNITLLNIIYKHDGRELRTMIL